jgi:integrase
LSARHGPAIVIDHGHRYTLALTRVEYGETMKEVVKRLVRIVRSRGVKIKFLLLDKGFFSVDVIRYLTRAGYGFVIPAFPRGRKPKPPKRLTGLRAMKKWKNGYYEHTLTSDVGGRRRSVRVTICIASKGYRCKKTGKRKTKKMLHTIWKVHLTPKEIREIYRKRFGIETSYRQMNEARIRTCTRDPGVRLLFIGVALVLRNVWVWLHFHFGLRKGELASLTLAHLVIDSEPAYLILKAKDEKAKRGAIFPLHPALGEAIHASLLDREVANGKPLSMSTPLFNVPPALSKIFNRDIALAGIEKRDALDRVIDVHCLRHSHASLLAQAGVSPAVAQKSMRHSDVKLTMDVYTHLEMGEVADAVALLPTLAMKHDESHVARLELECLQEIKDSQFAPEFALKRYHRQN